MSQSKWLVAAIVPGIKRQPLKNYANEELPFSSCIVGAKEAFHCVRCVLPGDRVGFLARRFQTVGGAVADAALRPPLERPFAKILDVPPTFRSRLAGRSPDVGKRKSSDDRRIFLVIQRVEFSEAFPAFAQNTGKKASIS